MQVHMSRVLAVLVSATIAMSTPQAMAMQNGWGAWQKTSKCRTLRLKVGPGSGNIESPQVPGVPQAYECIWERFKTECPRLVDKLKKPVKCFNRREVSDWSVNTPRN